MKWLMPIIVIFVICFSVSLVSAQDKVVVIPMGSSAKGTDGQVQYNDNGMTAGAHLYYDKETGKLEVPGEVRTVDESGNNRLWGEGRPGTGLITHDTPNGYCTTSEGINLALSKGSDIWGNADDLCPIGTWVCTQNDMLDGSCPIEPTIDVLWYRCDFSTPTAQLYSYRYGWVADEYNEHGLTTEGIVARSDGWENINKPTITKCYMIRAWCCWE